MKQCTKCEKEKVDADFYPKTRKCKQCTCDDVRNNRRNKYEQYSAYEKKRYQENPIRRKALQAIASNWRKENPEAYKAQTAVSNAVRDGRLHKEPCLFCATTNHVHAHHNDYARPLDVVWMCAKCHHRMHANFPEYHGHKHEETRI